MEPIICRLRWFRGILTQKLRRNRFRYFSDKNRGRACLSGTVGRNNLDHRNTVLKILRRKIQCERTTAHRNERRVLKLGRLHNLRTDYGSVFVIVDLGSKYSVSHGRIRGTCHSTGY